MWSSYRCSVGVRTSSVWHQRRLGGGASVVVLLGLGAIAVCCPPPMDALEELDSIMVPMGGVDDDAKVAPASATRAASRTSQAVATPPRGTWAGAQECGRRPCGVAVKAKAPSQESDDDAAGVDHGGQPDGEADSVVRRAGPLRVAKRRRARARAGPSTCKGAGADSADDDRPRLGCQRPRHRGVCYYSGAELGRAYPHTRGQWCTYVLTLGGWCVLPSRPSARSRCG